MTDIEVWDNGGETIDRYAIRIGQEVYGMSANPKSANPKIGYFQHKYTLENGQTIKDAYVHELPSDLQVKLGQHKYLQSHADLEEAIKYLWRLIHGKKIPISKVPKEVRDTISDLEAQLKKKM